MAKAKPITGCIIMRPLSDSRAMAMIRILQEGRNKQVGVPSKVIVRERRPGDTSKDMVQSIYGVRRNETEAMS